MIQVDLKAIIKSKSPRLYKWLPGFVISIIGRILCVKGVNNILEVSDGKDGVDFIISTLDYLNIKRTSEGRENIDENGRYIFASNHPLGGLDAFSAAESIKGRFGSVKLVVNDVLMILHPLKNIFIPVNKFGRQKPEYVTQFRDELNSDTQIFYFPAGLCSRLIKGQIQDLVWHKSFVDKAIESKRGIVPMFVDAKNSNFFYRFALLRKKLGVKANLEMLLLPSELFKKKNKGVIRIIYGKPITYNELVESSLSRKEWAKEIRRRAYNLKTV